MFLLQGDIADEEFSQYFSQFGEIEDCVVSSAANCLMTYVLHQAILRAACTMKLVFHQVDHAAA